MIKLSELKVVESALFKASLKYDKVSLYSYLLKNFSEDKDFDSVSEEKINQLILNTSDGFAHNVLLKDDLVSVQEIVKKKMNLMNKRGLRKCLRFIKRLKSI